MRLKTRKQKILKYKMKNKIYNYYIKMKILILMQNTKWL